MKSCPRCKSTSRYRIKREWYVKLIPGSHSYACDNCNARYTWFPLINRSFLIV